MSLSLCVVSRLPLLHAAGVALFLRRVLRLLWPMYVGFDGVHSMMRAARMNRLCQAVAPVQKSHPSACGLSQCTLLSARMQYPRYGTYRRDKPSDAPGGRVDATEDER